MVFKMEITRQSILCSIHPIKYPLKYEKEKENSLKIWAGSQKDEDYMLLFYSS